MAHMRAAGYKNRFVQIADVWTVVLLSDVSFTALGTLYVEGFRVFESGLQG